MQEIWSWIKGYEGLYQISNYGRIMSFKNGRYGKRKIGKLIKPYIVNSYYYIHLWLNKDHKPFRIARLVAQVFISNPENKPEVNHRDGVKTNNYYKNLEWATRSENTLHAYRVLHKKMGLKKGEKCIFSKLKENEVIEIRNLYKTGEYTYKTIGEIYGIYKANIGHIIKKQIWKHI